MAVVFDILLATTTIATLLNHGAKEVIPVMDEAEALKVAGNHEKTTTIIAGESDGLTIEGFADPLPTQLKQVAEGKQLFFQQRMARLPFELSRTPRRYMPLHWLTDMLLPKKSQLNIRMIRSS